MDKSEEDDERYVEDVPEREERLPLVERLVPQLVRIHQNDRDRQRDQKSWFLMRKKWQESEPGDEAELGNLL